MISKIEIGKTYRLMGDLVYALCFQDYANLGRCLFIEKRDGTRVVFTERLALRSLDEIGVEVESIEPKEICA